MLIMHDISIFMTWFLSQVVNIFSFVYNTLESIQFMGTNLLKVILTITILSAILPVFLTLIKNPSVYSERYSNRGGSHDKKSK